MAFLLRLHVWRPAGLIVSGKGKKGKDLPILHDALKKLMDEGTPMTEDNTPMEDDDGVLKWETPIEKWKDAHERIFGKATPSATRNFGIQREIEMARTWVVELARNPAETKGWVVGQE